MYLHSVRAKCDFCGLVVEDERESSHYRSDHKPQGWLQYYGLVCPDCQRKHTIYQLYTLSKRIRAEQKEQEEATD